MTIKLRRVDPEILIAAQEEEIADLRAKLEEAYQSIRDEARRSGALEAKLREAEAECAEMREYLRQLMVEYESLPSDPGMRECVRILSGQGGRKALAVIEAAKAYHCGGITPHVSPQRFRELRDNVKKALKEFEGDK